MKNRKGCVMGTSIHKAKSSGKSPMKLFGRRKAGAAAAMDAGTGPVDASATTGAMGMGAGGGRGIGKALFNPAGAMADKMGMGDTKLGKALNPLGGLFGRK